MAALQIRLLGDPALRRKAQPVTAVDDEIRRLMDDLLETMYAADGVGLAAPQVGVSGRVFVVDLRDPAVPPFGLVNPVVLEQSQETDRGEEGCLSIPGLREIVERPARVVVEGLDREGLPRRIEADGLLARVLQHEIDHLDGVLFIDRVSPLKRQMLLKRWRKLKVES
ncbi:MAG: peptide deformylase [Gemmatimonadetes bacterium]|nr:peptide deformylase [Gemmatimonadota bacterium]